MKHKPLHANPLILKDPKNEVHSLFYQHEKLELYRFVDRLAQLQKIFLLEV